MKTVIQWKENHFLRENYYTNIWYYFFFFCCFSSSSSSHGEENEIFFCEMPNTSETLKIIELANWNRVLCVYECDCCVSSMIASVCLYTQPHNTVAFFCFALFPRKCSIYHRISTRKWNFPDEFVGISAFPSICVNITRWFPVKAFIYCEIV